MEEWQYQVQPLGPLPLTAAIVALSCLVHQHVGVWRADNGQEWHLSVPVSERNNNNDSNNKMNQNNIHLFALQEG